MPLAVYLLVSEATIFLTLPLLIISGIAIIALEFFECPKCEEPFFHISPFSLKYSEFRFLQGHRPFTQKCIHCGFPKWDDPK